MFGFDLIYFRPPSKHLSDVWKDSKQNETITQRRIKCLHEKEGVNVNKSPIRNYDHAYTQIRCDGRRAAFQMPPLEELCPSKIALSILQMMALGTETFL